MDDSRPYTIPYSGSRSRSSTEGFAPASQPPPAREMGGSVVSPLQGATIAEDPPAPSHHGTGPSTKGNDTTEQACNAYLGPMKYRCQTGTEDPPADTVVHLAENTVESSKDKSIKSQLCREHTDAAGKSAEVNSTVFQSMDGACDEPEAPDNSSKQSSENGLHDLSECRPCRLFTIAHSGQRPEFCDRCKNQNLTCSLCNHELCPATQNQQMGNEPHDPAASPPTSLHEQLERKIEQQAKDLDQAHIKIRELENELRRQTRQNNSRIQGLTFVIDQASAHSQGIMRYATGLQTQVAQQGSQLRNQEATMAEMKVQINQFATIHEAYTAAIEKIEADVSDFSRTILEKANRLSRQVRNMQTRVSAISHRLFSARKRKAQRAPALEEPSDPEAKDWVNIE